MRHCRAFHVLAFALLVAMVGCTSVAERKQRHFALGNDHAAKGEYPEAIIEYRNAVQLDEKFGPARYRLALAYEHTGDMNQAFREMVRAADLMPDDTDVQLRAGGLLLLAGRYEDAAARAQKVLGRDPKNVDALILLGKGGAGLKDSDSALALLQNATKQLPDDPRLQQSVGELQRSRGNLGAAEAALKRAVALAPQSLQPRQTLALYYSSVGRNADAEQILKDAVAFESPDLPITRDLAVLYFLQGRDGEAEPLFVKIVAAFPNDASFRVALGDLLARNRRFDEAIAAYEAVADVKDIAPIVTARIAFAEYESSRREAAHKRLADAMAKTPRNTDLRTMSARLYLADRKFEAAEAAAKIVLELEPDRFEPLYVAGTAALEQGRRAEALQALRKAALAAPKAVGPQIQLGRLFLERGETDTALQYAKEAAALAPAQPLAQLLLVRAYTAAGDIRNAQASADVLLRNYSASAEAQSASGNVALLKKDHPAARRAFARALDLDPRSAEAFAGMIQIELNENRPTEAVALAGRSIAQHPDDPRLLLVAARTFLAAKDTGRAEATLQQALKLSGAAAPLDAYGMLAGIYFSQHRLDEAKAQFERVAREQPAAIGPPTMIGIILQLQNKPKEAQVVYERLLEQNAQAAVAANNLAMLLADAGEQLDVALNHAQTAKTALPQDAAINDTLGWVYYKKGLSSLAISSFKLSAARDPANPVYQYHLGLAYAQSGDKNNARQALGAALKLSADFEGAAEARSALRSISG